MTKSDIVNEVSKRTGVAKHDVDVVVNAFIGTVIDAMKAHKRIEIRGFGIFTVKKTSKRIARNPRTGEPVLLPEKFTPVLKISKEFKKIVDDVAEKNK